MTAEQQPQNPSRTATDGRFAVQIFADMQKQGVQVDVVICCSMISALERGGQWQLAEQVGGPTLSQHLQHPHTGLHVVDQTCLHFILRKPLCACMLFKFCRPRPSRFVSPGFWLLHLRTLYITSFSASYRHWRYLAEDRPVCILLLHPLWLPLLSWQSNCPVDLLVFVYSLNVTPHPDGILPLVSLSLFTFDYRSHHTQAIHSL